MVEEESPDIERRTVVHDLDILRQEFRSSEDVDVFPVTLWSFVLQDPCSGG